MASKLSVTMTSLVTPSGRRDIELEVFVQTDGGDRCRVEIGLGQGDRRNRHLIGGVGFIVVDGVAGIGQCADAHAGLAAVGADHAGAVERGGLSGQRGPIRLDGVVQDLVRLHDGIHAHVKGETDSSAGINTVGWIPAEDRLIGAQGRGVDIVRRIAAAHIADVGQVAAASRSSSTRRLYAVAVPVLVAVTVTVRISAASALATANVLVRTMSGSVTWMSTWPKLSTTGLPASSIYRAVAYCGRITVGNHISVVGIGGVFHTADEPDLEIVTIADRAVGHALIAEIPFHKVVGTGRRYGAAGNEVCR